MLSDEAMGSGTAPRSWITMVSGSFSQDLGRRAANRGAGGAAYGPMLLRG